MTEYVEHLFNTCPICLEGGKRVLLYIDKGNEQECHECGCVWGKFRMPKSLHEKRMLQCFGVTELQKVK